MAQVGACYLLIANRGLLSGDAGDVLFIKLIPWAVLVMFGAGVVMALWLRARSREPLRSDRPLRRHRPAGRARQLSKESA